MYWAVISVCLILSYSFLDFDFILTQRTPTVSPLSCRFFFTLILLTLPAERCWIILYICTLYEYIS